MSPSSSFTRLTMGTTARIQVPEAEMAGGRAAALERAVAEALEVFDEVQATCSRFDPGSALSRANAAPGRFHRLPRRCYAAVLSAQRAYAATRGRFDPRVLGDLVRLGYDRSFEHVRHRQAAGACGGRRRELGPWRPSFKGAAGEVRLGAHPIDLGGIGKGLAVAWASELLAARGVPVHLVEAGGDLQTGPVPAPGDDGWHIGVEDPAGGETPVAVLELAGMGCATSSTRLRAWRAGGRDVHHLIDPKLGLPGGGGLSSVTVVAASVAWAEVWAKVLFLAGPQIGGLARRKGLAACWVTASGEVATSPAMERHVIWRR